MKGLKKTIVALVSCASLALLAACGGGSNAASSAASSAASAASSAAASAAESTDAVSEAASSTASSAASEAAEPAADGKVYQIGVCTRAFSSPWQTYCYEVMQEIADENPDIELDFQDGQEDANVQVNILQTFIEQKKDLVVVFANQEGTLTAAVNQVVDAGIPVINTQGYVGDGSKAMTYIGCDDNTNGWGQGELMHKCIGKDEGKIIVIQALLGTAYTTNRTLGLEKYIEENCPGVEIVAMEPADNDNAKAANAMQNLMTRFPAGEIDAVVVQGPHDCVAAANAAKDAGRDDLIGKFIAMDYATTVENAIKEGLVFGTVDQNPGLYGEKTMEIAMAYLRGELAEEDVEPQYMMEFPLVDKDNIEEYGPAPWD